MIPSIRSSAPHHAGALAQLSEALEQQQQALRATLAKLEAELPPEAEHRLRRGDPELPDSTLGRQARRLRGSRLRPAAGRVRSPGPLTPQVSALL